MNPVDEAGAMRAGEELDASRLGAYLAEQFPDKQTGLIASRNRVGIWQVEIKA